MSRTDDLYSLPPDLPVPVDDGAADHLKGSQVPEISLRSTGGDLVDLSRLKGRSVVYCYPRTGLPDRDPPAGWDAIPGARGCTPQSCAYRDHHDELRALGARVFGMSTQTPEEQREAAERLRLTFPLLSDSKLRMTKALRLPTFTVDSMTLLKRVTLVLDDGRIERVFYPVFPPDADAGAVIDWVRTHPRSREVEEGLRVTIASALSNVPTPDGKRFARVLARGSLEVELYAPSGTDPQHPHTRDELYVVVSGKGFFVNGPSLHPFGPGDVLFVPAGTVHRFEDFSDDLVVWVVFYGPEGGEAGRPTPKRSGG
jgi:peroxiredoxin